MDTSESSPDPSWTDVVYRSRSKVQHVPGGVRVRFAGKDCCEAAQRRGRLTLLIGILQWTVAILSVIGTLALIIWIGSMFFSKEK